MCVNFKLLNENRVNQEFPMPIFDEHLDRLQGSAECSTFDPADACLKIRIQQYDAHKTAFHLCRHMFEYTCMLCGLVNAPAELYQQVGHDFLGPTKEGLIAV